MEEKVADKICSACGTEYKAGKVEAGILMLLRLCPVCLEKWYRKQHIQTIDEMYDNLWDHNFDSSLSKNKK